MVWCKGTIFSIKYEWIMLPGMGVGRNTIAVRSGVWYDCVEYALTYSMVKLRAQWGFCYKERVLHIILAVGNSEGQRDQIYFLNHNDRHVVICNISLEPQIVLVSKPSWLSMYSQNIFPISTLCFLPMSCHHHVSTSHFLPKASQYTISLANVRQNTTYLYWPFPVRIIPLLS